MQEDSKVEEVAEKAKEVASENAQAVADQAEKVANKAEEGVMAVSEFEPVETITDKIESWIDTFLAMLPNMAVAIVLFIIFLIAAKAVQKVFLKVFTKASNNKALHNLFGTIIYYIVMGHRPLYHPGGSPIRKGSHFSPGRYWCDRARAGFCFSGHCGQFRIRNHTGIQDTLSRRRHCQGR